LLARIRPWRESARDQFAPKKEGRMSPRKKPKLVSMRLTEAQYGYLEDMVRRVKNLTGMRVTRTSVILKLMEFGLPVMEKDFPKSKGDEESEAIKEKANRDSSRNAS
jgi:hypothetical protein